MGIKKVLTKLGLEGKIICKAPNLNFWSNSDYKEYYPRRNYTAEEREMDDLYRTHDINLINISNGVRLQMTYYESYEGDEMTYNLYSVFVKASDLKNYDLLDIDFEKRVFITKQKIISFDEVDRTP